MKMTRNEKGEVETDSGISLKVPQDVSMLSVLGQNQVVDGGDYTGEYLIRVDDKVIGKWFLQYERIRYWPPILNDVKRLEQRYFRVKQAEQKYWKKVHKSTFEALQKVGNAHCRVAHKHQGNNHWWLYDGNEHGISFNWCEEPSKPINLEIGQTYYDSDQRMRDLYMRTYKFFKILDLAITSKFLPHKTKARMAVVKLNDRNYLYSATEYPSGYVKWTFVSNDKDAVLNINL